MSQDFESPPAGQETLVAHWRKDRSEAYELTATTIRRMSESSRRTWSVALAEIRGVQLGLDGLGGTTCTLKLANGESKRINSRDFGEAERQRAEGFRTLLFALHLALAQTTPPPAFHRGANAAWYWAKASPVLYPLCALFGVVVFIITTSTSVLVALGTFFTSWITMVRINRAALVNGKHRPYDPMSIPPELLLERPLVAVAEEDISRAEPSPPQATSAPPAAPRKARRDWMLLTPLLGAGVVFLLQAIAFEAKAFDFRFEFKPSLPKLSKAPEFVLTDHLNTSFDSRTRLEGKVWLASFISTDCSECEEVLKRLAYLHRSTEDLGARFQLVSFAIDPDNERPEVLKALADAHAATERWSFLTGSVDVLQSTVAPGLELGKYERPADDREGLRGAARIGHSVLVDASGQVRGHYTSSDLHTLIGDIKRLARD